MIKFTKVELKEHKEYERWVTRQITLRGIYPSAHVTMTIPVSKITEYNENKGIYIELLIDHLVNGKELPLDFPRIVSIEVNALYLN